MSNLSANFTSFTSFLNGADEFYAVNFSALNSSGVDGSAIIAVGDGDDDSRVLNISLSAEGLAPSVQHAQHIHGLFDGDMTPIDSTTPTIQDDADLDGIVEVIEGFAQYGDIILTLLGSDGALPFADANGDLTFFASYDLDNDDLFFSPFGNDYTSADLMPLDLREIVLHGVEVPAGIGEGTGGEVDGTQDGLVGILPAAAGEIEKIDRIEAFDILDDQIDMASFTTALTGGADFFDGGAGEDRIFGGGGDDTLLGGGNDDLIEGGAGTDVVSGGSGNDVIEAGSADTNETNAADLKAAGSLTIDDYDNAYAGGSGDDTLNGGDGDDIITGDDESRVATATGETFDAAADGADMIFGGAGNDEIHVGSWADGDDGFANTHTGSGADFASGGDGNDILIGDAGADTLTGDAGNDTVKAGDGKDFVDGGTGDDNLDGGNGADLIYGGSGDDTMFGGTEGDTLVGQDGDDVLSGGSSGDLLFGGDGDDFLNGGFGNDRINTGTGDDKIFHAGVAGHGTDFVQDYDGDSDVFIFGGNANATEDDFLVQFAETANAGEAGVSEAFITYEPTGQILWALIDGAEQDQINISLGGETFDLLA